MVMVNLMYEVGYIFSMLILLFIRKHKHSVSPSYTVSTPHPTGQLRNSGSLNQFQELQFEEKRH